MFTLRLDRDLQLELMEERDAKELYRLVDANRAQLERFLPWATTATLEGERAFLRANLERFARGGGFDGGLRVDGELAGGLGVFNIRRDVGRAEYGYWLAQPWRGRGVMTRAVTAMTRVLFERQGFERVEIRCETENVASRRVAERAGFRHEGTLRRIHPLAGGGAADLEVFGLLKSEWSPAPGGETA